MTGATGSGKTAIALLISIYVCLGGRKLGPHEIEQGRVLYITTENPMDVRMRLIGMAQQMAFDPASIDRNFLVIEDIDAGLTLEMLRQIRTEVGEVGEVALVVVDTSSALFRGSDDNINTETIAHAKRQRLLCALPGRPAVITLCHPTKNAATKEALIPRGGGGFLAEVDGNLCITRLSDRIAELHWTGKFRGPDFQAVAFCFETLHTTRLTDKQGRLLPTVMAIVAGEAEIEAAAGRQAAEEKELLRAISASPAAAQNDWARAAGWLTGDKPNRSRVRRVVDRLEHKKLVMKVGNTYVLTLAGKASAASPS
jgi:RecA-family ATPase